MKPTIEEQIKLWEWCGCKRDELEPFTWKCPDGTRYTKFESMPDTDLNFLFKYAVPKLPLTHIFWQFHRTYNEAHLWNGTNQLGKGYDENPALALFWAIYKIINPSP